VYLCILEKFRNNMAKIIVKDTEVVFYKREQEDFISLTDMARYKDTMEPSLVISHWMSTRYTVDFMGIWESVNKSKIFFSYS